MIRSNKQRHQSLDIPSNEGNNGFKGVKDSSGEAEAFIQSTKPGNVPPDRLFSMIKAVLVCALYMVIGPTLILNNKYILKDLDFQYPMFVSCMGLITTSVVSHLLVGTGFVKLEHREIVGRQFYLRNIFPVGFALSLTLAFGNAVYIYLGVALIQMLKAFTPVVVLAGVVLTGLQSPSRGVVISVICIAIGTALNCAGSVDYTFYGLSLMFLAEFFEAVRLVLTQFLLKNKKFGVIEGQYWIAPASATCLMSMSALTEWGDMYQTGKLLTTISMGNNWRYFFLSATLGLFVNLSSFLVVQTTNSVTLKILGTVRNAGLVVFQVVFGGEIITANQFAAYMLTLVAFGFYNYYNMKKSQPQVANSTTETNKNSNPNKV